MLRFSPVLSYLAPPVLRLGPVEVSAFHLLVLAALVSGWEIAVRRAVRFGFPAAQAWTLAVGLSFIGLVGSQCSTCSSIPRGR